MTDPSRPQRYAPDEGSERTALAGLDFLTPSQKAFCLDRRNNIQHVRNELHRVHPGPMLALDCKITGRTPAPMPGAPPKAASAPTPTAVTQAPSFVDPEKRADDLERIRSAFGLHGPAKSSFDSKTQIQRFGVS